MKRWCLWYADVPEPDYMDWIDLPDICEDDIDGFMLANFDAELTKIYYGGSVRYYESLEFTFRAEEGVCRTGATAITSFAPNIWRRAGRMENLDGEE